jgi:large conductance mechanosensitive channel
MPRINEYGQEESATLLDEGRQKVRRVIDGFIDFALQGNILEIAFGLM